MTHFTNFFRSIALLLLAVIASTVNSQEKTLPPSPTDCFAEAAPLQADSFEISLLTCEPFHSIYALYGHTGLRIHNLRTGDDMVANWGIFDMSKSLFALRFAFGLTDYTMAIEPFDGFCARYRHYGSGVQEQVLNLTPEETQRVLAAIWQNFQPENRVYRYNFFYDNCTTRARDMVTRNLTAPLHYAPLQSATSFRQMIHQWNGSHLWMRWGNDLLLGVGADQETDRSDQQFLPDSLRKDFDHAVVIRGNQPTPLVRETRWPVEPMYEKGHNSWVDEYLLSPWGVGIALVVVLIAVALVESCRRRRLWQFDALLLLFTGTIGLVLLAMVFSQHPTVSLNLQILVYNPLALLFFWPIVKKLRRSENSKFYTLLGFCYGLALIGCFWQHYSEGFIELLCVLIIRAAAPHNYLKEKK